jgi:multidrug efflux pump subunit AcrB
MNFVSSLLAQKRTILTVAFLCVISGVLAWQYMPRDEDPQMPNYWGIVVAGFPGADATTVEKLVLEPIEEKLAEINGLRYVSSYARSNAAILHLSLLPSVDKDNIPGIWDEIRRALNDVRRDLPEEALDPVLNNAVSDLESIVLAITGSDDLTILGTTADELKKKLLKTSTIAKVKPVNDPREQITIELDDSAVRRLGIDTSKLLRQLQATNRLIPGGTLLVDHQDVSLIAGKGFSSLEDIRQIPTMLPSGKTIPLASFAEVYKEQETPVQTRMWYNGEPAVGLGIVPKDGINLGTFEKQVKQAVKDFGIKKAPLSINTVVNQPVHVNERISQLTDSLLFSILIVASFLIIAMGFRLGIIVSFTIPLVALSSLAIFYGVVNHAALQQVSIASFVIALGMLVDNAIVITEGIQFKLDQGVSANTAAKETITELFWPLGASTGTTIAAFIPMLLAVGLVADFTVAVPQVMIISLSISFVFAVTVTPILSMTFLRKRTNADNKFKIAGLVRLSDFISNISVNNRKFVVLFVIVLVAGSIFCARFISRQFFPSSDKPILITTVTLPEGTHLDVTSEELHKLTEALKKIPYVKRVTSFAGRSVPHFYYNLPNQFNSPHYGQLVIDVCSTNDLEPLMDWIRTTGQSLVPGADLLPTKIEQGPKLKAPIEVRLYGSDLDKLAKKTMEIRKIVQAIPGTRDTRHSLGTGTPVVDFFIHDSTAAKYGLERSAVSSSLLKASRGIIVGPYRSGEDSISIKLKNGSNNLPAVISDVNELLSLDIATPGQSPIPLATVAIPKFKWNPAAIEHYNFQRIATVTAYLKKGIEYSDVTNILDKKLKTVKLDGLQLENGGAKEGADDANKSMASAMPLGVALLLAILLIEFRSYRKVALVFLTVPMAASGIVPGLLLSNQPFGFMSLLGSVALIGIVVNNAIILVDVIDRLREEGMNIEQAVKTAISRRIRPILLTTTTTVAGLLPLALSNTTLWPPLAWTLISGLISSTILTLLMIPSLYLLVFKNMDNRQLVISRQE